MRMCWHPRKRAEKSQSQPKINTPLPKDTPSPRDCETLDTTRLSTPRRGPTHAYTHVRTVTPISKDRSACVLSDKHTWHTRGKTECPYETVELNIWEIGFDWHLFNSKMFFRNKTGMWPHLITWQAVASAEDTEVTTFLSGNLSVLAREALGGLVPICFF